ncbi:MAG: metal-dependent transcriptional regulator [Candidatus Korarchaeum sp.]|nr:metal-dependent transcriptional regulator [Candidatus Korarchaeum sp.]MDW8035745.1 metal-dependent transcriptional regulator [Candidatus Korarchaeum sp.]
MGSKITPGLQEYLTAIYRLQKVNKRAVRMKELAKELGVTLPSVTDALKKLSKAGLINYRRYNEVTLTDAGERSALLILDKESIFYYFLRNILGVEEDLAMEEACWIEHGVSWESAERLKLFIEFIRENIENIDLKFRKFVEERS